VTTALPLLETLDSTQVHRRVPRSEPTTIVVRIASQMLMVRFEEMMAEWEGSTLDNKPLAYIKVSAHELHHFPLSPLSLPPSPLPPFLIAVSLWDLISRTPFYFPTGTRESLFCFVATPEPSSSISVSRDWFCYTCI
jgi:hypothetical protein